VATRFIGLEAENKQLRPNYEFEHSRVNAMADKLKAAEEALEEVKASLAAAEKRLEDEKSTRKTREGYIRQLSTFLFLVSTLVLLVISSSIPFLSLT
jgi:chromosome segregation ATPase